MWFWTSNMWNHMFLHQRPEFGEDQYDPYVSVTSFCNWSATMSFNTTPCNMIFRPFLTSKSIQRAPDHVLDIPVHLLITPDRLNASNSEYSWSSCLDHQYHDFGDFFWKLTLKATGVVTNGHFNGQNLKFGLSLPIPQEGLSITSLWVEESIYKVNPIFIPPLQGVVLKLLVNFDQNQMFSGSNSTELRLLSGCL